jgi:hypothetical protein
MSRAKAKTKTAVLTLRVSPAVKAAAKRVAELDRRSVANLVEVLILDRCKALNIPPEVNIPKESRR